MRAPRGVVAVHQSPMVILPVAAAPVPRLMNITTGPFDESEQFFWLGVDIARQMYPELNLDTKEQFTDRQRQIYRDWWTQIKSYVAGMTEAEQRATITSILANVRPVWLADP
jgi:hypothetical protein